MAELCARIDVEAAHDAMAASPKFCGVIFALISKWGAKHLRGSAAFHDRHKAVLRRALERCSSFMAKPAMRKLDKLKLVRKK